MTKEEYTQQKEEIIKLLGKPDYDFDRTPLNESAKRIADLNNQNRMQAKLAKKLKDVELAGKQIAPANLSSDQLKTKFSHLNEITVLEADLAEFSGIDKEIARSHMSDRQLSPKTLANMYGVPYQRVAGLLKQRKMLVLKAKYFNETLSENTQIALLKLTQHADPKIVLAAAEYLKLLKTDSKDSEKDLTASVVDPVASKALSKLSDWLLSDGESDFTLTRAELK